MEKKFHLCVTWDTRDTHDVYNDSKTAKEACRALSTEPDVVCAVVVDEEYQVHACYARYPK